MERIKKTKNKSNQNSISTPSNLRVSSSTSERLRRLIITFIYALFIGIGVSHIHSFANANGAILADPISGGASAIFYKISSFIFSIVVISGTAFYIFYSAKVQKKLTWMRMWRYLINAIFPFVGMILLMSGVIGAVDVNAVHVGANVSFGTNIYIYLVIGGSAISVIWTVVENIIHKKNFPASFKITLCLLPGVLAMIGGLFMFTTAHFTEGGKLMDVMIPALVVGGGMIISLIAAALTVKASDYDNKLKKLVKYGFVSHLIITFTILACFLFTMTNLSLLLKDILGLAIFAIQALATIVMIAFIVITSWDKKNHLSNPIRNKILLMSYIAFVNILGLLVIFQTPATFSQMNKSEFAFTFLGISALQTLIVVIVAGVMAYVTIEFKGLAAVAMAVIQILLILSLTAVIYMEKDVAIITQLMGRFIVLIIYGSMIIIYLLFELYWIFFLLKGEKVDRTSRKREKSNQEEIEDSSEDEVTGGQNA